MNKKKNKLIPELRFPEFAKSAEWEVKSLGEVLIKNSAKNRNQKYSLVESVSNKFGFIKQDEYFENRRVASKDTSNYYVIKKGHFAYNPSRIDVGSLAYKHDDKISIISPLYVSFKANNDLVDDYFLLNFFNSVGFTKQMIFEGGVRNTLNYENLIQIKIPIPKLKEQQKIASCLSSLDELIEAHTQKLYLLKDHKKGLMQNLFPQEGEKVPKYRFKEFEKDGEWVEKKLGSFCSNISSGKDKNTAKGKFELYGSTGIIGKSKNASYDGDYILVARVGANAGLLNRTKGKFGVTDNTLVVDLDKDKVIDFIFYSLEKVGLNKFVFGSGQPLITGRQLKSLKLQIPKSKKEQQKIASVLSSLDELITAQTEKIEQLKEHKKGLMQGLFPEIMAQG